MSQDSLHNIVQIENHFMQVAAEILEQPFTLESTLERLNLTPLFLRSIAYESASMAIAYLDLTKKPHGKQWENFFAQTPDMHKWHVQIGLGLGYAKADILPKIDSEYTSSIYDGFGYYNALFRGRKTIKMQQIPYELSDEHLRWFDVGVGRRLWYTAKGNPKVASQWVGLFDEHRWHGLWHGLGIACGYVGGVSTEMLHQIASLAGDNVSSFKHGVGLALTNRKDSNSICMQTEAAFTITFNS